MPNSTFAAIARLDPLEKAAGAGGHVHRAQSIAGPCRLRQTSSNVRHTHRSWQVDKATVVLARIGSYSGGIAGLVKVGVNVRSRIGKLPRYQVASEQLLGLGQDWEAGQQHAVLSRVFFPAYYRTGALLAPRKRTSIGIPRRSPRLRG